MIILLSIVRRDWHDTVSSCILYQKGGNVHAQDKSESR